MKWSNADQISLISVHIHSMCTLIMGGRKVSAYGVVSVLLACLPLFQFLHTLTNAIIRHRKFRISVGYIYTQEITSISSYNSSMKYRYRLSNAMADKDGKIFIEFGKV